MQLRTLLTTLPWVGFILLLVALSCQSSKKKNSQTERTSTEKPVLTLLLPQDKKLVLLPIQESCPEAQLTLVTGKPSDTAMDIRLAIDSVDYYVPMEIKSKGGKQLRIEGLADSTLTLKAIRYADSFEAGEPDYYRPNYHHTPTYGWMNDPNGLFYKDGLYHLYYQYNPYGAMWGNMHWGHSTSRDLVHWQEQPLALERDTLGHIFSGSAVVDKNNTAGFGKNAVVAFYTAHRWIGNEQWQAQCLAYSLDNGHTFTKYEANPILLPHDGVRDFRDPKVFWHEPKRQWYMIVSADLEMRFYSSTNLKDWTYLSSFGKGYGVQPNQFECPDFFELAVDGNPSLKKWVMVVNINPGCLWGGSATEYFVGDFDGKAFTPDTAPSVTKWMDYGKDHYAFVTFSNTSGRVLGLPWVSNWQYAQLTPFRQTRGMNGIPRELKLFTSKDGYYLASSPAVETQKLRQSTSTDLKEEVIQESKPLITPIKSESAEILVKFKASKETKQTRLTLYNDSTQQEVLIVLDWQKGRLYMDRTKSGLVDFAKDSKVHDRENHDNRKTNAVNYQNDFALATWAPLYLLSSAQEGVHELHLFIDKSSIELFVDGGRIAMTNLIFPTSPYNKLKLSNQGGSLQCLRLTQYKLLP